jgi:hypothetical protein
MLFMVDISIYQTFEVKLPSACSLILFIRIYLLIRDFISNVSLLNARANLLNSISLLTYSAYELCTVYMFMIF